VSKNIVALPIPDRRQPSVSDATKCSVQLIKRTARQECARQLRELAASVERNETPMITCRYIDLNFEVMSIDYDHRGSPGLQRGARVHGQGD
jgi:hypothetical protein